MEQTAELIRRSSSDRHTALLPLQDEGWSAPVAQGQSRTLPLAQSRSAHSSRLESCQTGTRASDAEMGRNTLPHESQQAVPPKNHGKAMTPVREAAAPAPQASMGWCLA